MAAFTFAQVGAPWMPDLPKASSQGQMTRRFFARCEMVMVPSFRRHGQAARLPVHANEVAAGRPHERITFTGDDNDLRARTVAMRFFIRAGFYGHNMAYHRIAGEMNTQ